MVIHGTRELTNKVDTILFFYRKYRDKRETDLEYLRGVMSMSGLKTESAERILAQYGESIDRQSSRIKVEKNNHADELFEKYVLKERKNGR